MAAGTPCRAPPCRAGTPCKGAGRPARTVWRRSGARDASRVLRLVDTVNTRSGERVRVLWVQHAEDVRRYPEWLAETLLPVSREALQLKRQPPQHRAPAEGLARRQNREPTRSSPVGNWFGTDWKTYASLPNGAAGPNTASCTATAQVRPLVPPNFLLLSGAIPPTSSIWKPKPWFKVCPDFDKGRAPCSPPLYRKAKAYEAGERIEFNGRTYPPLYTPAIAPCSPCSTQDDEMKAFKPSSRRKKRRSATGNVIEKNLVIIQHVINRDVKKVAEQRRLQAQLLRASGLSWMEVGKIPGISAAARSLVRR